MERSKQNKHVVCNKDNDVYNGVKDGDDDGVDDDDDVDNDVDDCVDIGDNGVDGVDLAADKRLAHLSQGADCCLMERSKQNKDAV
eukprot:5389442-Ditylum_brightwellii.AAC.1